MSITPDAGNTGRGAVESVPEKMAWLLEQFAEDVPGVTHAVLLSRDGLRLLDSGVDKDWADQLAAAVCGMASIADNVKGPSDDKRPARQILIERDDCLILVQNAGGSRAFDNHPSAVHGVVDTVLAVVTTPDANNVGPVAFEMSRLIAKFGDFMEVPVRTAASDVAP
ncbi:roadblock/LC7 domain-containing protein [Streptomyces rubradiris]|uniref:Roadblock/LAMTOR2 domain-containing protein n=1 Tax=Streptomyces rubradiris TaxID=285531 RepID=A0ABQ3RA65_STRRR|nr:roadblock/LC7 domain-containing protein [Streptomyces rubradiris]GHH25804.1 hypothetical protein GCM10018792_65390 [Streptomyces rubradiris]GHI52744.1 hypothetical protein Srubr_25900 [Streptomyces rubradiris]